MANNNKKLYNYIVNTLGVTRDMVKEVIEQRVDAVLERVMKEKLNDSSIEKMVLDRTSHIIKHGHSSRYHERDSFDELVAKHVRSAVEKRVMKEFKIQVTAKPRVSVRKPKKRKKTA